MDVISKISIRGLGVKNEMSSINLENDPRKKFKMGGGEDWGTGSIGDGGIQR